MLIRAENENDRAAVYAVNVAAFESPDEATLVNVLREQARPLVSLVAEQHVVEKGGDLVGHIMFSPVSLSGHAGFKAMGLAPMAVAPEHQGKGIGTALVLEGLEQCRLLGIAAVVVLGHPGYYPRFGFLPSSRFGIDCEYDVPEEAFMAMELQPGALSEKTGRVEYHEAFSAL